MRVPPPLLRVFWLVLFLGAAGRFSMAVYEKVDWQNYVTNFARPTLADDPTQASGRESGQRYLLLPEGSTVGYEWVAQAQQLVHEKSWRLEKVDYDNAPNGRAPQGPALYPLWLASLGWVWAMAAGVPWAHGIEAVAPWSNALTLWVLVLFAGGWVARCRGLRAGAAVGTGLFLLYPWVVPFASAQPSAHSFTLAVALAGLTAGWLRTPASAGTSPLASFVSGALLGLGFWLDTTLLSALWLSVVLGVGLASLADRSVGVKSLSAWDWRIWSWAQGLVVAVISFVEGGLASWSDVSFDRASPLLALLLIGVGEGVARLAPGSSAATFGTRPSRLWRGGVLCLFCVAAGVGWVIEQNASTAATGLVSLLDGWASPGMPWWKSSSSLVEPWWLWLTVGAALLMSLGMLWPRAGVESEVLRSEGALWLSLVSALLLSLGSTSALLIVALWILLGWLDASTRLGAMGTLRSGSVLVAMAVLGLSGWLALNTSHPNSGKEFSEAEAKRLVERDFAYWLAARMGEEEAVVLAPAPLSLSLWFHGGVKVLGTPHAGNKEGFMATVRLSSASSADEAKALYEGRSVTHVVLPSWDDGLYGYARLGAAEPEKGFLSLLHGWLPPRWLRPIPYQMPQLSGWEGQSVSVFEVVDLQDQATALAHLGQYFLQTGRNRQALAVSRTLAETFPEDLISLWVQGQVARAARDNRQAQERLDAIVAQMEMGNDEGLAWDDRVGLSLFLAEMKQTELARGRLTQLLEAPEDRLLRRLGSIDLFRVLRVTQALSVPWGDPAQRTRAEGWLPAEYRDQLRPSR